MDEAWIRTEKLWLYGASRPRECDPVFDVWRAHHKLTPDLVKQRIELAMEKNRTLLAKYLTRYLTDEKIRWVDVWFDSIKRPAGILNTDWSEIDPRMAEKILYKAMVILIRRDTQKAARTFDTLKAQPGSFRTGYRPHRTGNSPVSGAEAPAPGP